MKESLAEITQSRKLSALTPELLFGNLAENQGAIWFDSSISFEDRGRYSYILYNPDAELKWENNEIVYSKNNHTINIKKHQNFFQLLDKLSKEYEWAVGYISYESSLPFLDIISTQKNSTIPLAHFYFYKTALIYDHENSSFINPDDKLIDEILSDRIENEIHINNKSLMHSPVTCSISKPDYFKKINIIKDHIKEGDIYQANFTTRYEQKSDIPPFEVYKRLRRLNPAAYSAYMNFGDYRLLSSSPERMFKKDNHLIKSAPIKGTIKRGETDSEDLINLNKLLNSEKDKAELLMIVDLIRNDLGKIARTGTVKVDSLFKVEKYSSLFHLVSDISAELNQRVELSDIFRALLPGGSITGAPKKRAIEIIDSVESVPRGVYTGCIGFINREKADFNIAIRTMVHKNSRYQLHAGGGIVADSNPEDEYNEMMLKAKNMIKSLGI